MLRLWIYHDESFIFKTIFFNTVNKPDTAAHEVLYEVFRLNYEAAIIDPGIQSQDLLL